MITAGNLKSGTCNSPLPQSPLASFFRATLSKRKSKIMLAERRRGGYLSICEQQKITVSKESNFCWSFDFGSTLSQTDMCWELHSIFLMEALGSCHLFAKESNFYCSFDFGSTLSQTDMCWELHSIFLMEALGSCHRFASSKFPSVTTDDQWQILWNCNMCPKFLNFGEKWVNF